MKKFIPLIVLALFFNDSFAQSSQSETYRMILKDGWQMQSALKDPSPAGILSQDKFEPKGWYKKRAIYHHSRITCQ
jgi:hypothetical protein